ncbi:hamartin-like [Salarias fasciatus]|uniref:hamartin-like n=1 Tax=Salarias fasciatus TaxID=181472 RepID=UPI001176E27B|nr:hamartin-like [Salarias fasciatus]
MSREQASIPELLLSLDSSDLQEAELVRAAVDQQLNSDRGGSVLQSLVEHYLDTSSHQAVLLLSSIRERHHKPLLEKLNEILARTGSRLSVLTLLSHLVQKQPPWVHLVCRSPLLPALLRCLKTDSDVVVLITGVLVLITLLPMIPQAGKQHIYDFFDVFGRLASWTYRNPGQVPAVQLVHLHAAVYSLFHRLYGMFPCNFMSYLRLHYSMKENLDTFQEVVKPMLQHVRVHPELVTGTQDYELDPSRWRCFEVHDIVLECSRVSLDPLESSCEEDALSSPRPGPQQHVLCSLQTSTPIQADISWSPSSHCGLETPPPDPAGSAHPLTTTPPLVRCAGVTPPTEDSSQAQGSITSPLTKLQPIREQDGSSAFQPIREQDGPSAFQPIREQDGPSAFQPIREQELGALDDVISSPAELPPHEAPPPQPSWTRPFPATSSGSALTFAPTVLLPPRAEGDCGPAPPYEPLLSLALRRDAALFRTKTEEPGEEPEEDHALVSPLKVLDQLIVHGHDAHHRLSRRWSAGSRSGDRRLSAGPAPQGEELQSLRSQLLLVHAQLQYERFKRQQHAVRNRRLLRRVVNATALEEQGAAMRAQLSMQEEELRCVRRSLQEEQRRCSQLRDDSSSQTHTLHTHTQRLLLQLQEEQRESQRLQSELQECESRMRNLEAELQKARNKAHSAEHQLSQLAAKLSSSEQLQQQIFLMNQQLVLLRETNRALNEQLDTTETHSWTEASMLQCIVGKEFQRLKESEVQHRQKLEAANHRTAELENQLLKKDQLIQDQKKLMEDTKAQSRGELSSSEARCVSLRRLCQTLQSEMLQLYSQTDTHTPGRPNGGSKPRPSSSAVGVVNGGPSSPHSHSPIESPLAAGSFLERHARQLFGPANQSPEEAEPQHGWEEKEEEEEEEGQTQSPVQEGQEMEEAMLLTGSPPLEPPPRAAPSCSSTSTTSSSTTSSSSSTSTTSSSDSTSTTTSSSSTTSSSADLTLAVRQRRHELSIMDYDETLPEF